MSNLNLFRSGDDFGQQFALWWQRQLQASGARRRLRPPAQDTIPESSPAGSARECLTPPTLTALL